MEFQGKTVLVTGSARHTGLGIAKAFLKAEADVGINSPNPENVARALGQLRSEGFSKVFDAAGDVSREVDVKAIMDKTLAATGRLDILVNNACHLGVGPSLLDMSAAFWDEVMGVNARGCFLCSKHAVEKMLGHGGAIINISSTCSMKSIRKRSAYCASKGAVDALTKAMALELAGYGIRVNAISLGYVRTSRWDELPPEVVKRRCLNVPLGAGADYEDVASLAMFLASAASKHITGAIYVLDGGVDAQQYPKDCEI